MKMLIVLKHLSHKGTGRIEEREMGMGKGEQGKGIREEETGKKKKK